MLTTFSRIRNLNRAREIAQKFPEAQVVGIDLVSVPLTAYVYDHL